MPMPSLPWLLTRSDLQGMGGHHAPREEILEAEASSMRCAVVGGRRVVVVAGERRISGNRGARSGYPDAEHLGQSRNHCR